MNKFVNISGAIFRDFVKCEQCPECIFVIFNMTKTKKKDDDVARDKWTKGQRLRMAEIYRVICTNTATGGGISEVDSKDIFAFHPFQKSKIEMWLIQEHHHIIDGPLTASVTKKTKQKEHNLVQMFPAGYTHYVL